MEKTNAQNGQSWNCKGRLRSNLHFKLVSKTSILESFAVLLHRFFFSSFNFTFFLFDIIFCFFTLLTLPLRISLTAQETYTFTIGYHELTGSKVKMKKPVLVLKKIKRMDVEGTGDGNSSGVELEVVGVIRHKILFKSRPKALISGMPYLAISKISVLSIY